MEPTVIIRHRAGLVVRLIDTSTGREIEQRDISFARNGKPLCPMYRSDGKLVFLDFPQEDCTLEVRARSFYPKEVALKNELLTSQMPLAEIHLVPDQDYAARWPCGTVAGIWPDIEEIDAVRMADAACLAQTYDERRRILNLFNPHHLALDRTYYAVVNPDDCRYEPIEIVERCSDQKFRLSEPLQHPFGNYFPVARRILGAVLPQGHYALRVPEDASDRRWLVRWRSGGRDFYQLVDFALPDSVTLRSPPEGRAESGTEPCKGG